MGERGRSVGGVGERGQSVDGQMSEDGMWRVRVVEVGKQAGEMGERGRSVHSA